MILMARSITCTAHGASGWWQLRAAPRRAAAPQQRCHHQQNEEQSCSGSVRTCLAAAQGAGSTGWRLMQPCCAAAPGEAVLEEALEHTEVTTS